MRRFLNANLNRKPSIAKFLASMDPITDAFYPDNGAEPYASLSVSVNPGASARATLVDVYGEPGMPRQLLVTVQKMDRVVLVFRDSVVLAVPSARCKKLWGPEIPTRQYKACIESDLRRSGDLARAQGAAQDQVIGIVASKL